MHQYTWFMLLGLTLAGGIIAFMGDRLGRYMGKRRMTLFGLRPRHTALCFTVVAGMLISVTSLVAMSLLSAHVRLAIFRVDDLKREGEQLQQERDELQSQNRRLVSESRRLRSDYDLSKERARLAAAEERRLRQQLDQRLRRLDETRAQAEQRVAALQREVVKRSRLAAEKSTEIARLGSRMRSVQDALGRVSTRLVEARERHRQAEDRYQEAAARYAEVSARCTDVSDKLATAQTNLDTTRADLNRLQAEVKGLTEQVRASRTQIHTLEAAKAQLEVSRDSLHAEVTTLREQRDTLIRTAEDANRRSADMANSYYEQRLRAMVFTLGDELAWDVIDGREPRARIRSRLDALVEQARSRMRSRLDVLVKQAGSPAGSQGAGNGENPQASLKVVRLVSPDDGGKPGEQKVFFDANALDIVAEEISRANTGVVAQIRAATNTVAGEPVLAEIQLWQNRLVYHEGEMIARTEISGRQTTGEIVQDLVALLQGDVRSSAVHRGMVPRAATPGMAQAPPIGEVPLADLVAVAEQVRKHRGGAVVEAVSPADLWTADPMRVSFRVSPRPAEQAPRRGGSVLTGQ